MSNTSDQTTADAIPPAQQKDPLCTDIETLLLSGSYSIIQFVQLLLLATTLGSIAVLIYKYNKKRVHMHGNLMLLFANIVAIYFLHSIGHFVCIFRYRLLLLFYREPCQLLTPIWMVVLFYGPTYLYYVAYPLFHFCVMVERVRATCLAERYEQEGRCFGICMVAVNWFLSLGFLAFVIGAALADSLLFSRPQGIIFLTSQYNNVSTFYVSIATLALTIFTALADWRVTQLNRRIRANNSHFANYSLSRNFQLNENVLAMRLIFPLDTAYALLYAFYTLIMIMLRGHRATLGNWDFSYFYNLANTLLFLYSAITMLVYIRFLAFVGRSQRRNVSQKRSSMPEARVYFKLLEQQWA